MTIKTRQILLLGSLAAGLGLAAGCMNFGPLASRLADKQVYGLEEEAEAQALGRQIESNIEPTSSTLTQTVISQAGMQTARAGEEQPTTGGMVINLADALALAVDNNWDWASRKENLYLTALQLTEAQHRYAPIFTGSLSASATRQPGAGNTVERFGNANSSFGVNQLLATGARVSVGFTNSFFQQFAAPHTTTASGLFSASIVQPLLQGAGTLVTMENLTQAERNLIYAVRDLARYRKNFVIDRISEYYRLLQAREQIDNEYRAFQRLTVARERAELMQQAQRMAAFQVDQARQDEINARNSWITAKTNYINALNQFKLDLGLPVELNIQPDEGDLTALNDQGLVQVSYSLDAAEKAALAQRLDYKTALQEVEDAGRQVKIAANGLLPQLDVTGNLSVPDGGNNQPLDLQWRDRTGSVGVNAEIPLDRLTERNNYRRAEINLERSRRAAEQLRDQIVLDVRQSFQDISQARQSYEIQAASLELAQRRVDSVAMLLEAGQQGITIRDQLEAQSALLSAQNSVTRALVDFTIARLRFYNSIESLDIDDQGMWHENTSD